MVRTFLLDGTAALSPAFSIMRGSATRPLFLGEAAPPRSLEPFTLALVGPAQQGAALPRKSAFFGTLCPKMPISEARKTPI